MSVNKKKGALEILGFGHGKQHRMIRSLRTEFD
jgi:hypothetical protein